MASRKKKRISLGTVVMLLVTASVLAGFVLLLPSFTGNQDIFIDAQRLAVAMDDSLSDLTLFYDENPPLDSLPLATIIPPFTSKSDSGTPASVPTPIPTPTVSPIRSFTLCAAGSIELNNEVRKALTIDQFTDYSLLTDQITQDLQADLSIAVLQNTISQSNKLSNVNMSADLLTAIRSAGVNALNIANANMLNFGEQGLNETAEAVRAAGMTPLGFSAPTTLTVNGVNVALLHYQDRLSSVGRKAANEAQQTELIRPVDLPLITSDISAARTAGAQVIIVTLNWGETGRDQPSDEQIVLAQAMADAGADIILGTGNGALQPVQVLSAQRGDQKYHPVLCAYSLGNLFSPERDSRVTLASLLLKTSVVYDTSTQTVAFDDLNYTPTYAWRGKDNGRTLQRILINDLGNLPAFVDSNQQGVMDRCMTLVRNLMDQTAIPISE